MNDNVNYEDEILEGEEENTEENSGKSKSGSEKIVRICIAAIIVAIVVVAILATTVMSMTKNEEETTLPAEESTLATGENTTLLPEATTSPAEKYAPGTYTVKVGDNGRLNLRKEPSKDGEQILTILTGTLLEITEIKYDATAEEDFQYWGRTLHKGWDAWVSMKYLVNAYSESIVTPGEVTTAPAEGTTAAEEQTTTAVTPEETTAAATAPEATTAAPEAIKGSSASFSFSTGTYKVIAEPHLNMRENHDVGSLSIAQIPANSTVTVEDVYHDANSTNEYTKYWGKVTFGGYTGWVAMGYLE